MSDPRDILKQRLARELKSRSMREMLEDEVFVTELANNFPEVINEFASWASFATGLDAKASFSVPLLLDFTYSDGTKRAAVVPLTLMLIPAGAPRQWEGWVPDPASAAIQIDSEFNASLTGTRVRLNSLDPEFPLWPENADFHIRWHITPDAHVGTLSGRSADCIIALGVIELLRKAQLISSDHSLICHIGSWTPASWHCLSASAQVDELGIVRPVPAAPLQRKFASSAKGSVDTILVNLSPDQSHLSAAHAASSPELIPITSLQEAVFYLALRGQPLSAAKQRIHIRRRMIFLLTAVCIMVALSTALWWGLWLSYPSSSVLRQRLPMATIDQSALPTNCKHLIVLPKLSKEGWNTRVLPVLKEIRSHYALVIGSDTVPPNSDDQFPLQGLGDLSGLRSLQLVNSSINELPGIELLQNLEEILIVNSYVKSVEWAAELPKLRLLILDSPWIEKIPYNWKNPELEFASIHFIARDNDAINFSECTRLRFLAISAENLKQLGVSGSNSHLEELILATPRLNEWGGCFSNIRRFALVGFTSSDNTTNAIDLAPFQNLEELSIENGRIKQITNLHILRNLQRLKVTDTPVLRIEEIEMLKSLKELIIRFVPKSSIANISSLSHLEVLTLWSTELSELTGIDQLSSLRELSLSPETGSMPKLPSLKNLKDLTELNVSATNQQTIPLLGSTKSCKVNICGEKLTDENSGQVIKNEGGIITWHPTSNGQGTLEITKNNFDYSSPGLYALYKQFTINGETFRLTYQDGYPTWTREEQSQSNTNIDLWSLHFAANWRHMAEQYKIRFGFEFLKDW